MTKCKSFSIIYISGNCSVCNVKSENTVIRTISVTWYIKYDNLQQTYFHRTPAYTKVTFKKLLTPYNAFRGSVYAGVNVHVYIY